MADVAPSGAEIFPRYGNRGRVHRKRHPKQLPESRGRQVSALLRSARRRARASGPVQQLAYLSLILYGTILVALLAGLKFAWERKKQASAAEIRACFEG